MRLETGTTIDFNAQKVKWLEQEIDMKERGHWQKLDHHCTARRA